MLCTTSCISIARFCNTYQRTNQRFVSLLPRNKHNRVFSIPHRKLFTSTRVCLSATASGDMSSDSKSVLVPVANGSEEMEAVITIDVLRRAGANVTVASVEDSLEVLCSRNVKLVADVLITECVDTPYDLIALPVGWGGGRVHLMMFFSLYVCVCKRAPTPHTGGYAWCRAPA